MISVLCRWYQLKITMRWEDSEYTSVGTPARVVQYEGTSVGVLVSSNASSSIT